MSNLPEKWRPSNLPARRDEHRELERLENKIARWKSQADPVLYLPQRSRVNQPVATHASMGWNLPNFARPVTTEAFLDFPRKCADTGLLWAARYEREQGDRYFRYLRSTVSESYQCVTRYTPDKLRSTPDVVLGVEVCPHCGAFTNNGCLGSIWCPGCQQHVCFGRTSRSGYFKCLCGTHGQLVNGELRAQGYR